MLHTIRCCYVLAHSDNTRIRGGKIRGAHADNTTHSKTFRFEDNHTCFDLVVYMQERSSLKLPPSQRLTDEQWELLTKLVKNSTKPDPKFRILKRSNGTLKKNIFSKILAMRVLTGLGFEPSSEGLVLPERRVCRVERVLASEKKDLTALRKAIERASLADPPVEPVLPPPVVGAGPVVPSPARQQELPVQQDQEPRVAASPPRRRATSREESSPQDPPDELDFIRSADSLRSRRGGTGPGAAAVKEKSSLSSSAAQQQTPQQRQQNFFQHEQPAEETTRGDWPGSTSVLTRDQQGAPISNDVHAVRAEQHRRYRERLASESGYGNSGTGEQDRGNCVVM